MARLYLLISLISVVSYSFTQTSRSTIFISTKRSTTFYTLSENIDSEQNQPISTNNYSEENKYKIRNTLLEYSLGETRKLYQEALDEKSNIEDQISRHIENEKQLQLKVNELAQELNYIANQLLEKVQSSSARENSLLRIIEEGQLNLTRSQIKYEEYRKSTEDRLRETSNTMVALRQASEETRMNNAILSSRNKILETVVNQLKEKLVELKSFLEDSTNREKYLAADNQVLKDELLLLKEQLRTQQILSDQINEEPQAAVSDELLSLKNRLASEVESCQLIKSGLQEELASLHTFIEEARIEYRALVSSMSAVSAMDKTMMLDTIHLQAGYNEDLKLKNLVTENSYAIKHLLTEISSLKSQLRSGSPNKETHVDSLRRKFNKITNSFGSGLSGLILSGQDKEENEGSEVLATYIRISES